MRDRFGGLGNRVKMAQRADPSLTGCILDSGIESMQRVVCNGINSQLLCIEGLLRLFGLFEAAGQHELLLTYY